MNTIKFSFKYWKRNLPLACLFQVLSFIAIIADLMIPMLSQLFIDYVIGNKEPDHKSVFDFLLTGEYGGIHTMELCISIGVVFMCILLFQILLIYIKNLGNQKLGLRLETDLRKVTYKKLMMLDSETLSEINTGELLTTINSDTIMFKELYSRMIPVMLDCIFAISLSMYFLSKFSVSLMFIPILITPFFFISLVRFRKFAHKNYREIRGSNSKMNLTVQENIEAVRLVRSFTNEDVEREKFDKSNHRLQEAYTNQVKLASKFEVVFSSIRQFAYIGTIAIGSLLVVNGVLFAGYLVAASAYAMKIMDFITQINNTLFQMQQQLVSGQKMIDFLNLESRVPDKGTVKGQADMPNIKINNVSMIIDDRTILKHINLDIPYGKKVGIVGGTGSGKSVLLESLVRIHDVSCGSIEINGINVKDYSLEDLRNYYSYVFQDVFLFSNTVDSNIAYSEPEIEKNAVTNASKHAQAHSFIMELSEGYNTVIGERGLGVSGGQKQRVSIARALLKNADIFIFDDSTSALDVNTEKKLLEDIKTYYPEKTILISAHRISSVIDCDEIIYLQDGMILERGSFEELLALDGHFAQIYHIQETQAVVAVD